MKEVSVRKACPQDGSAIARFCREALGYSCTEDEVTCRLTALLSKDTEMIVVAEADGQTVGFAHAGEYRLLYQPFMMNLMGIAVDTAYRGMGIGRAMLSAIEEHARERGAVGVRVISGIGREDAHAFYRAVGYADTGESKKFFKKV